MSFFVSEEIKDIISVEDKKNDATFNIGNKSFALRIKKVKFKNNLINFTCNVAENVINLLLINRENLSISIKDLFSGEIKSESISVERKNNQFKIQFKVRRQ